MHTVSLIKVRLLTETEFNSLKNSTAYAIMLTNRVRLSIPVGDLSQQFERSVKDFIQANCASLVYVGRQNGSLDVYFRSKTDAAGFVLVWAGKVWGE
jgi:hypothetical protein